MPCRAEVSYGSMSHRSASVRERTLVVRTGFMIHQRLAGISAEMSTLLVSLTLSAIC